MTHCTRYRRCTRRNGPGSEQTYGRVIVCRVVRGAITKCVTAPALLTPTHAQRGHARAPHLLPYQYTTALLCAGGALPCCVCGSVTKTAVPDDDTIDKARDVLAWLPLLPVPLPAPCLGSAEQQRQCTRDCKAAVEAAFIAVGQPVPERFTCKSPGILQSLVDSEHQVWCKSCRQRASVTLTHQGTV